MITCQRCGQPPKGTDTLSATGICMACVAAAQLANCRGLRDDTSVPYKRWRAAYSVSLPGRGAFTTPPREWRFRARRKPYRVTVEQVNMDPLA